jgi:hypothetical protein
MSGQKVIVLGVLVMIGMLIYVDPRCTGTCKRVLRGVGKNLFG